MPILKHRRRVLFVDDEKSVHAYERKISTNLGLKARFAFSPEQANRIIRLRLAAIRRLQGKKLVQLKIARTPKQKKLLQEQWKALERMNTAPFDLIVSDINMPRGHPTGIGFVWGLKERFPRQKLLMHSDDTENMRNLWQDHGIPASSKLDIYDEPWPLDEAINSMLHQKRKK